MLVLITGGSGSGKSAYAEEYLSMLSKDETKYYIATMQVYDEEGKKKIERHRSMRSGKGFVTIEQPMKIESALDSIVQYESENIMPQSRSKRIALLECMSNLTANEMFSGENITDGKVVVDRILSGIQKLTNEIEHLVIVTNNVFEDGCVYDEMTMEYIKAMGGINEELAVRADQVIEVVVGIPVVIK